MGNQIKIIRVIPFFCNLSDHCCIVMDLSLPKNLNKPPRERIPIKDWFQEMNS